MDSTASIQRKRSRKYRRPIRHGWNAIRHIQITPGRATIPKTEEATIIAGMTPTSGIEEAIKSHIKSKKDIITIMETEAGITLTATGESHSAHDVKSHIMC